MPVSKFPSHFKPLFTKKPACKVIVYGGRGALGSTLVDIFKKHNLWVLNIDFAKHDSADENVIIDGNADWLQQEQAILTQVSSYVSTKVDDIFCVDDGCWADCNAAKDEFIKNCDMMWKKSVWSSTIAARLASIHLKEGGILQLTGAAAANSRTPGMIGYGMAKAAVHHLVSSLSSPDSGLPKNSSVVAILPITLDTPMNRKLMPDVDHSSWTPMPWIGEQFLSWLKDAKPRSGSLLKIVTVKQTNFQAQLGLIYVADRQLTLSIHPQTAKINASIPDYLPHVSSLRHLFTWCLDIRRAPGRPLLRIFAESASEESEKRRLLELCSAQGMNDFTAYVRQAGLSIADVLLAFPSVKPSVDRLFEHLPRLIPPYSVASAKGRRVRFVFSVLDFPAEDGRRYTRKGPATEWLLSLKVGDVVQIMAKEPAHFRLPPPPLPMEDALNMPLLMIGPGTGVSVFLSFCQHLLDELEAYVREGILTELISCESQGTAGRPKYVQDALKENATKVKKFIQTESQIPSRIFICEKTSAEAISFLADLEKADRYVEDVWS